MIHPDNQRHARIWAAIYVKELVSRGYGSGKASKETSLGRGGPNEAGYSISHGKISVPGCTPNWTFSFAALEKEAQNAHPKPKPMEQPILL